MSCLFLLCSKMNQLYIHITHLLLFAFPSQLGHHRALDRVLCATQEGPLVTYFTQQICQCQTPSSRHPSLPPWHPHVCSPVSISPAVHLNSQMKWPFILNNKSNYLVLYELLLVAKTVKNLPAMRDTHIGSLGWEDPLEKGMATHSLAWEFHRQRSLVGYSP